MNFPRTYSSSSSSLESEVGYKEENHYNKRCKYEWHHRTIRGMDVFIFIRVCKCGEYEDMSYLRRKNMDKKEFDGKDVHYHRSCKWERFKKWSMGQKIYTLSANCDSEGCTASYYGKYAYTCTTNMVQKSYT